MRIGLWSIGAICLLVGLSLWLVTRSWFMIWQLGPQLERRLGGDVEIGSAVYERGGTLVFRDVTLRSRAHPGPAGEVLRVGRLEVRVDLHELISGNLRLERIQLEQVIIRASEDANEPGVFSFMALEPDWSRHEDIDQLVLPPQVQIRDAVLELGVHDGARYEMRGRQRVSGQMSPLYENDPWYNLVLSEIDDHPGIGMLDACQDRNFSLSGLDRRAHESLSLIGVESGVLAACTSDQQRSLPRANSTIYHKPDVDLERVQI